jgi:hypothetical protein
VTSTASSEGEMGGLRESEVPVSSRGTSSPWNGEAKLARLGKSRRGANVSHQVSTSRMILQTHHTSKLRVVDHGRTCKLRSMDRGSLAVLLEASTTSKFSSSLNHVLELKPLDRLGVGTKRR